MKVLYLRASSGLDGAYPDFVKAIEGRFPFEVYDPDRPPAEQFEGVGVVVDPGGAVGTRALIDAALAADVKLWHVTTNGTDKVDVAYFLEQGLPLANSPRTAERGAAGRTRGDADPLLRQEPRPQSCGRVAAHDRRRVGGQEAGSASSGASCCRFLTQCWARSRFLHLWRTGTTSWRRSST